MECLRCPHFHIEHYYYLILQPQTPQARNQNGIEFCAVVRRAWVCGGGRFEVQVAGDEKREMESGVEEGEEENHNVILEL